MSVGFARLIISSEEMSELCDKPNTATLPEGLAANVVLIALSRIWTPWLIDGVRGKLLRTSG